MTNSNKDYQYKKFEQRFRNCWDLGHTAIHDGIIILNEIIDYLLENNSFSIKEIILKILEENDDLVGLTYSKIISFLNVKNKNLYRRELK